MPQKVGRTCFRNPLDGHDLLLNLVNQRDKALDVNGLDRPMGRHRQRVSDRGMRKNVMAAPGTSHLQTVPPGYREQFCHGPIIGILTHRAE